jgi:hypothetical protein
MEPHCHTLAQALKYNQITPINTKISIYPCEVKFALSKLKILLYGTAAPFQINIPAMAH